MTSLPITGRTRMYGIIGDPIVQVRSPEVYTRKFADAGVDAVLVPLHIGADEIDAVLPALLRLKNLDGLLVTSPFKTNALAIADEVHSRGRRIGAVNALRRDEQNRWHADMFDGEGFVRGLLAKGHALKEKRALVIGCGGAGAAIAVSLADAGVAHITLCDLDREKARALASQLDASCDGCTIVPGDANADDADLIVNASVVGMKPGDGMPAPFESFRSAQIVGDVVLRPPGEPTALIAKAIECGCPVVTGIDMHSGQIDAILEFFRIA
ncbi:shikimate 5-dehydrogenase [Caballeronia pedi]|uniref:Shikimate 5-dehydrogenase n=1 Tax=Caballeronia pedi TaxID=1777141 RepID=A0A158D799_9BURK|nr:ThiF family adenylyltransferase [Caballeronia pedi]SAK90220.1 shikimate 5-dehydrogenase [Caballeronia pedi]